MIKLHAKRAFTYLSLFLCTCLGAGVSHAVTFSSPLETTQWQMNASIFACKLYQSVDLYGEAVFLRRAGEPQRFYLHEDTQQLALGEATLSILSPRWNAIDQHKTVAKVQVFNSENVIQMDWLASQDLMDYLQHGQRLMFSHRAKYDESKQVRVMLEPIGFNMALAKFQDCLATLLPANYDQVHRTALYFSTSGKEFDEFSKQQKKKLDQLIRYALADKYVTALKIDGHTDSNGLRAENLELSKRRAEIVTQYLLERGVPKDMITTRWHGERYPKMSNRSASGRTQNRRVTIRLDRFDKDFPAVANRYIPAKN